MVIVQNSSHATKSDGGYQTIYPTQFIDKYKTNNNESDLFKSNFLIKSQC